MSRHNPAVTVWQIHDHLLVAKEFLQSRQRTDLDSDPMFRLATERLIIIIGEAVYRLPDELLAKYPKTAWHAIRGTRNVIVHGYDIVDRDRLWDILTVQIPELRKEIENIILTEGWPKPTI